ncbi:hypothetical protein [Mucilaginibacter sp.]|uniref:hypothetical protein n=1 Tax=Mucilaginibacter sp. TaxID=1882438 RepID=UPI00260942C5|nr:hypothetical protein [Mucilaginibacter sp.]MDB5032743.1 hypothetical protein [Mucilaginibacter sp.]
MIRTILKTDNNQLTLQLPNNMVGKMIEVIAFEIDQVKPVKDLEKAEKIAAIDKALSKHRVDLSNFKFDRDEANDYE